MKKLLETLRGKKFETPPIWIMRQAGRYLPEYLETRRQAGSFLDLCYNPKLASKVTLQPIERFNFDGSIIFSDILIILDALGVKVQFIKGEGPKLDLNGNLDDLSLNIDKLKPIYETVKLVKQGLDEYKTLIGFCGAPFTAACYLIEGGGSKNFDKVKRLAIKDDSYFSQIIDILIKNSVNYLQGQIDAGAEVIKLFDSWAGILSQEQYFKWVIEPNIQIVENLKAKNPNIPIICFPKGSGVLYADFAKNVNCTAIAIDQQVNRIWAKEILSQKHSKIIQGNLDNYLLAYGNLDQIQNQVKNILNDFKDVNFIFNLGHGILPDTKIQNVQKVIDLVRGN